MNISPDGVSVRFKTEPEELFEAEKSGAKPNTVRILDIDEYHQLRKRNPKKIFIQHQQEIFLRTITNVHATEGVFGKVIVVISWTNEKHHHPVQRETVPHGPGDHTQSLVGPHSVPVEPGPHNASFDYTAEVPSIPSICKCANCVGGVQGEGEDSSRIYMSKIPIAKTMRCPDCDGGLLKSRAGEFGKCTICQALFRVEEGGPMHD